MENLGALSILLAFCIAVFAVAAAVIGKYGKRPFLIVSAERAVYAAWGLLSAAAAYPGHAVDSHYAECRFAGRMGLGRQAMQLINSPGEVGGAVGKEGTAGAGTAAACRLDGRLILVDGSRVRGLRSFLRCWQIIP